jgi:hypothetical protein
MNSLQLISSYVIGNGMVPELLSLNSAQLPPKVTGK